MDRARSTKVEEEEWEQVIGGKTRREGTARKAKT
jgi:hypothetical protein